MEILAIIDLGGQQTKTIDRKIREMGIRTEICPVNIDVKKTEGISGIIISGEPEGNAEAAANLKEGLHSADVPVLQIGRESDSEMDELLDNFVNQVCGLEERYTTEDSIKTAVDHIKNQVGDNKVIVLLSGGVDSAVSAALLLKALDNDNIYAIHIDHGFMRKNESKSVCEGLKRLGLKNLQHINAKKAFFERTVQFEGRTIGPITAITDPEEKRNIIGTVFIEIVHEAAQELGLDLDKTFIAQGTLRPDLIESGSHLTGSSGKIVKTHHNDVSIVRKAREKGLIVETNWDLYKEEVRKVGRMLGLEPEVTERQPFPGPGLSVRLLCNDATDKLSDDEIKTFEQVMHGASLGGVLLPLRSVGVKDESRSYGHLALLCGDIASFDWAKTCDLSKKVTTGVNTVNRTAYVLSTATPSGIKNLACKTMHINDENVALLQELDHMVTTTLKPYKMSQTFCILLPIGIEKKYSVAIRTFVTDDFMTGRPAIIGEEIPLEVVKKLADDIIASFSEIEVVVYDVTGKPPGTCEWE